MYNNGDFEQDITNPLGISLFNADTTLANPAPPPVVEPFDLLNGTNFLLLNGTDFNLL